MREQLEQMLADARAEVRVIEKLLGITSTQPVSLPHIESNMAAAQPPMDILSQLRANGPIKPPSAPIPTTAIEGPEGTVRMLGANGITGHVPENELPQP